MKTRITVATALFLLAISGPSFGSQDSPPRPNPDFGNTNVRLDLTITVTDQRGTALLPPKTASLYVVDKDNGRIRMGQTATSTPQPANLHMPPTPVLNIDATPRLVTAGRIRVSLSFEYRPGADASKNDPIHVNERVSAILDDGKPMVVSQSSDPSTDRIVKVELKATILK